MLSELKSFILPFFKKMLYLFFKKNHPFQPVFIIGCGRSGTTILGNTLSKHKEIAYLNERRDLWHQAYPELDIWSGKNSNPKLFFDKHNVKDENTRKLVKLFHEEQVYRKGKILLEKLPINNFRLKFIQKCFPNARYIYLHRNGLEVANSIAKAIPNGWFGKNNLKLRLLLKHSDKPNLDLTKNIHKGLFEWSSSMEESHHFFSKLHKSLFIDLSYHSFLENPEYCLSKIFDFLDLDYDETLLTKLSVGISRRGKSIKGTDDEVLKLIGGDFLQESINNTYSPQFQLVDFKR